MKAHHYALTIAWTGNTGEGTKTYKGYSRDHTFSAEGKAPVACSSDPAFAGDKTRYNPEELLLASLSNCHMLWYLHLCAEAGVVVTAYTDAPKGIMVETADGGGKFESVTLHPTVTVQDAAMVSKANELHAKANAYCFIANSVNFPVHHTPTAKAE